MQYGITGYSHQLWDDYSQNLKDRPRKATRRRLYTWFALAASLTLLTWTSVPVSCQLNSDPICIHPRGRNNLLVDVARLTDFLQLYVQDEDAKVTWAYVYYMQLCECDWQHLALYIFSRMTSCRFIDQQWHPVFYNHIRLLLEVFLLRPSWLSNQADMNSSNYTTSTTWALRKVPCGHATFEGLIFNHSINQYLQIKSIYLQTLTAIRSFTRYTFIDCRLPQSIKLLRWHLILT